MSSKQLDTRKQRPGGNQEDDSRLDFPKWLFLAAIFVGGVYANIHYAYIPGAIRLAIGILVVGFMLFVASFTSSGAKAKRFVLGARTELRKVVWPTRQETIQMTFVVMLMVIAMSLILWAVDALFVWLISFVAA